MSASTVGQFVFLFFFTSFGSISVKNTSDASDS